jgi:hypothetical protein
MVTSVPYTPVAGAMVVIANVASGGTALFFLQEEKIMKPVRMNRILCFKFYRFIFFYFV